MIGARFELPSRRGDQTLDAVKFVLHVAGSDVAATEIARGLTFHEGDPVVSTNIVFAQQAGAALGATITVLAVPEQLHLGYGIFTTAYIQRSAKLVLGAPLRYAAARKLLSLYLDADVETARKRVEHEVTAGHPLTSQPGFTVEPRYILGSFKASPALGSLVSGLEETAKAFEPVDMERVERALVELFDSREPAQSVLVPSMAHSIVLGTIESLIITRLRTMRWQGLALLGYRIEEGREDVAVTRVSDTAEQRRRMDEYGRMLASSSMFNGELAWLKVYALHELDLMRVELDGAELETA